jgi:hypothetical protein
MSWRVEVPTAEVNAALAGPNGILMKGMLRRGLRVETSAKRMAPANKGRLRQSITTKIVYKSVDGMIVPVAEVGTDVDYAGFVHDGTGVYGPTGQPIRPKHYSYLVFTTKSGILIHATSVRGQRGTPFLKDALRSTIG